MGSNLSFVSKSFSSKPKLMRRMTLGYVRAVCSNTGPMRFMDVAVSYDCNFSCQHCSAELLKNNRPPLSILEYQRIACDAMECGVMAFHFTGGEPLLRNDLLDVINAFQPDKNLISIQTNGWLATDDFLQSYKSIGGDILCVSVDSVTPESHDSFRKKEGSWEKAVHALRRGRTFGFRTLLAATITHQSMNDGELEALTKYSMSLGALLSVNLAVPAGNWLGCSDFILTAADRAKLNAHIAANPHVRTDFQSNWRIRGCPAFKEKCYLSPYGDVIPCPFIHVKFGNVREQSLKEIRKNALRQEWLKVYHPVCIAAESREFIASAGCYRENLSSLPLDYRVSEAFR
jgi:radical SAM protein with 4Fe4S-binding SPASM domain